MKKNLLTLLCLLGVGVAAAQDRLITGKVTTEEDGSVLPGVSILIKVDGTGGSKNSSQVHPLHFVKTSFIKMRLQI